MNAFVDFIVRLLADTAKMPGIFIDQVVTADPLSAIIWAVGVVLTTVSVGIMAYFAVGALGINLPRLGRGPNERLD